MSILLKLVPTLVSWYLRFVKFTSKVIVLNPENLDLAKKMGKHGNYALAVWHEHYPTSVLTELDSGLVTMASQSKDGSLAADTISKLGFTPTRGSSSRGGAKALQSMIEQINEKRLNSAITVDGPRGPSYVPKKGILVVSHECEAPVLCIQSISTRRFCISKSWDKTKIPKPFGRIYVAYGRPFQVDNLNNDYFKSYSEQIVTTQQGLTKQIRKYVEY